MRAEIEQLKTMKSIDQAIRKFQVTELALARAEELQLRQEIQFQSDCIKEGVKKEKSSTKDLLPLMLFFLF